MREWKTLVAFRHYAAAMKQTGRSGFSLQFRLFALLITLLLAVMLGVLLILGATGTFRAGVAESHQLFESELSHLAQDVADDYGRLSVQCVELAESLAAGLERSLAADGLTPAQIQDRPDRLEAWLGQELYRLVSGLERSSSSGAFLILDATVNPTLAGASYSRAGVYLKNMEPNIVSQSFSNLRFLRGPQALARDNGLYLLPQWKLEFDMSDFDSYHTMLDTAQNRRLPLSRLYYWTPSLTLKGNSEEVMLCCAPLIASDGTVMGICGLEVSALLFKLSYSPDNNAYPQLFCMLSPDGDEGLRVQGGLFAGSYPAYPTNMTNDPLAVQPGDDGFVLFDQPDGAGYVGLSAPIRLYPADGAYSGETWTLALLLPRETWTRSLAGQNRLLLFGLAALLLVSVGLSFFISRKYIRPVLAAFDRIKEPSRADAPKTRIPEIDDLFKFLAAQDDQRPATPAGVLPQGQSSLFHQFVRNIDTLSMAERAVFDLYLEGHTAKEIADILCLSINTIKTHNKRIYMKLNVSSRKELMVYIEMMKEANDPRCLR